MGLPFTTRKATQADSESIFNLVYELAVFERAPNEVTNTTEAIQKHGWGENPLFHCWVAEVEGTIVGIALCYIRYSTWKGPVLYLEDLVVSEAMRKHGIGTALFNECVQFGRENGYPRMTWQVLDWNTPAIEFYKNYGASFDSEWVNCSISLQNESME
ncbi:MAG: GNAT family N-acetyltransferase [Bacteroidia bacterium]|nr:GNAT family N-acetyltransferase [Bacteroidia bacterium]